jgi:hypothetical protein
MSEISVNETSSDIIPSSGFETTPPIVDTEFEIIKTKYSDFSEAMDSALGSTSPDEEDVHDMQNLQSEFTQLSQDTEAKLAGIDPESSEAEVENSARAQIVKIIRELQQESSQGMTEKFFAHRGITGDGRDIEGQQIDIIQINPYNTLVRFKMTPQAQQRWDYEIYPVLSPDQISEKGYEFHSRTGEEIQMGNAWNVEIDNHTEIMISQGVFTGYKPKLFDTNTPIFDEKGKIIGFSKGPIFAHGEQVGYEAEIPGKDGKVHALTGAVTIDIFGTEDPELIAEKIELAFKFLGIDDALEQPDDEDTAYLKEKLYRDLHKLGDDDWQIVQEHFLYQNNVPLLSHLQRREVIPGYSTIVNPGESENYENIQLSHSIYQIEMLPSIINYGLISSHDRYSKGSGINGSSTKTDFYSGGADSVFLRACPEDKFKDDGSFARLPCLTINKEVLDRLDWRAAYIDGYGSKNPIDLAQSPIPEDFFEAISDSAIMMANEIMVEKGIGPDMITGIIVSTQEDVDFILDLLKTNDITEIAGKPIESMVKMVTEI